MSGLKITIYCWWFVLFKPAYRCITRIRLYRLLQSQCSAIYWILDM